MPTFLAKNARFVDFKVRMEVAPTLHPLDRAFPGSFFSCPSLSMIYLDMYINKITAFLKQNLMKAGIREELIWTTIIYVMSSKKILGLRRDIFADLMDPTKMYALNN